MLTMPGVTVFGVEAIGNALANRNDDFPTSPIAH